MIVSTHWGFAAAYCDDTKSEPTVPTKLEIMRDIASRLLYSTHRNAAIRGLARALGHPEGRFVSFARVSAIAPPSCHTDVDIVLSYLTQHTQNMTNEIDTFVVLRILLLS